MKSIKILNTCIQKKKTEIWMIFQFHFKKKSLREQLNCFLAGSENLTLTDIWQKRKKKTHFLCSLPYGLHGSVACMIVKTTKKVVLEKVQRCEESFIGTSIKEEVFLLLTGSAGDQLSRSVTLSGVSRFCQVLRHPASVVLWKMELLRSHPPLLPNRMEKKDRIRE